MPRTSGIITQFNGGELSPLMAGRVDVAKYAAGCETMDGFLPTTQGPALSCPGFRYVAEVKTSANRTWLVRFEYSAAQAYILEFGDLYIRFYTSRGQLLLAGVPYEIASPYTAAQLTAADGTFAINFCQTGDVVYLFHQSVATQKLSRLGATNWTIAAVTFARPPFADSNATATTIYSSATTGAVTLTASAATFTASMVGHSVLLEEKNVRDTLMWEAGKVIVINDRRRNDGKNYIALNNATTGGIAPTHTEGAAYDGNSGVQWSYLDSGSGYATITGYTNSTTVSATVVERIPENAVGAGNATTHWALSLFNAVDGYATCGTFFRERLVLARGRSMAFSVAGDFENFSEVVLGSTEGDVGFVRTLASGLVNSIRWLSPSSVLLVGTDGDEWAISESMQGEAFGPTNCQTKPQSAFGSSKASIQRVAGVTMFVQAAGRKVRAMGYSADTDGYRAPDITEYAEHISNSGVIQLAHQQEPYPWLWALRADGVLAGALFNSDQQATAWFTRSISGGVIECCSVIPSPNRDKEDLWVIVRLTVGGATKRYVCYLGDIANASMAQEDWFYVDVGATYDGAPATTISGLNHLEGLTVDVLADGGTHPQRTVSGGAIVLQAAASVVQVGLPTPGTLKPMPFNFGQHEGTAQGKITSVSAVTVRLWNSMGGAMGPSADKLDEMQYRTPSVPMGTPPPPFTGDIFSRGWNNTYTKQATVVISRNKPTPLNVVAIMPVASASTQ